MFRKADIRRATVGVRKKCFRTLLAGLAEAAFIELVPMKQSRTLRERELRRLFDERRRIDDLIKRISAVLKAMTAERRAASGFSETGRGESVDDRNLDRDEAFVALHQMKSDRYIRLSGRIAEEIEEIERIVEIKRLSADQGIDIDRLNEAKMLAIILGVIEDEETPLPETAGGSAIIRRNGQTVVAVAPAPGREEILAALTGRGFREEKSPLLKIPLARLRVRRVRLETRLKLLGGYHEAACNALPAELHSIRRFYEGKAAVIDGEMFSFSSEQLSFFEGWLDYRNIDRLRRLIAKSCGKDFVLSVGPSGDPEAPVILRNNRFIRPFEIMVRNLGCPGNNEIDPTPFAAAAFIFMFGLMFGDVGQGLTLTVLGILLPRLTHGDEKRLAFMKNFGAILRYAGLSAIFFGFVFGSVFGNEEALKPWWIRPTEEIDTLLLSVVMMGVFFNATGIVINVINRMMSGDLREALAGSRGLPGLWLYGGGFFLIGRCLSKGAVPSVVEIVICLMIPLAAFSLRILIKRRPGASGDHGEAFGLEYVMETGAEILETVASFLGNTLSFIRMGAFALGHAGLGFAVYTLAHMAGQDLVSPGALIVIVTGNVFIILLEGLLCSIQAMRLEFYEFFGKFFQGDGRPLKPFSVK
ncbi:MAG: hypothetical protein JW884_12590 [Deltaproteobacteria bacterium]|nr:hypothetical protein [Deltaproteobacteria bacterium]